MGKWGLRCYKLLNKIAEAPIRSLQAGKVVVLAAFGIHSTLPAWLSRLYLPAPGYFARYDLLLLADPAGASRQVDFLGCAEPIYQGKLTFLAEPAGASCQVDFLGCAESIYRKKSTFLA